MEPKRLIVACGGTGGHVFPGLAVAQELKRRGHVVEVWLSGRDIEKATLHGWDGAVFATGARQLSLRASPSVVRAFWNCRDGIKRFRPDAMLAMGSYSSLTPVLAARLYRVPVVLHEANAVPGKAVEFLSRYAEMTAVSFEETARWLPGRVTRYTGLPVRADLVGQPRFNEIPKGAFTVLVTGGSQGARRINELAAQAMCLLKRSDAAPFFVIHQCGAADEARLRDRYASAGVPAMVQAFIAEMGRAYASADLVICRAGASTCFELCLLGKAALLIPLPTAVRNHQHANAAVLARSNGADEGIQRELTGRSLMRYVKNKMEHPVLLERMSQAIRTLAVPDAASRVADVLEEAAG
ncbi:MAG TPA: UDP-N-acetylglucosamine--N-acetylmuramyl-(pentapeptide) pyrophosphoryl-undecaprenol N-acetylglucosamine transferase [Kiritimatiellia bacterium]|nr:UDP-N-acetylglucosamine--N-acetylmuramyl-(pentapeptide) pyrophosphoryl-undecaprenol N-acetylglucosamine transferase [Kiritimatiellia bacterium]HRU71132.1 UDP-N-acetylglucosamine--N-acetylmuramyl-(pentapeptide) pyrophosphoryl-undecaprenol N-acetylglucosamine transferase [Kiritimatiellia bacterium]